MRVRNHLYDDFEQWLLEQNPLVGLEDMARHHVDAFSEWLEEYMTFMYTSKRTRRDAAETLNVLVQRFGWLRQMLAGPWGILRTWDQLEPTVHHPPLPIAVLRALVVTALAWGWQQYAVALVLAFFGLLRPSELLALRRQDIALPMDHLEQAVLYLRIGLPKTRTRGARSQHVRIDETGIVALVQRYLKDLSPWQKIWNGSLNAFKRRLDLLQRAVLDKPYFLPSSLRPGGATYLFRQWDESLVRLQWRGRWRSFRMLEIYVQELGAAEILIRFPPGVRNRLASLGICFCNLLSA